MSGAGYKLRLLLADRVRYSAAAQRLLGAANIIRGLGARDLPQRLNHLANAYRIFAGAGKPQWVESRLRPYVEDAAKAAIWRDRRIGWSRVSPAAAERKINKGIVLKAPGPGSEKGVLLLSFEYNWLPLLCAEDLPGLLRAYTVICSPAWFPTNYQAVWSFAHLPDADVFFMIANRADVELFPRLRTGTQVAPLLGCDWINPDDYPARPRHQREIDIVMVANWAPFKRHWVLFRALRQIQRPLRIVLVGQPETGRTVEHVMREAEYYGVRDRIEFQNRLPIEEVTRLLCNARTSLVLSRREGYCNAVAESLAADTPVGLVKNAQMGPAAYINPQTGVFLDEADFANDLEAFLDRSQEFQPRAWAARHISCHVSSARLNEILRAHALARGQAWTRDICPLGWRPNPRYVHPADAARMQPAYAELKARHGLTWVGFSL